MGEKITGIARDTLRFILEASASTAPREFAGLLRAEGGIITEVLLVPGTESSEQGALLRLHMMPMMHTVGTVHSHPSPNFEPSDEDLAMFSHTGLVHIIAGPPYNEKSWRCYDSSGNPRPLKVIDIEFKEEYFE